MLDGAPITPWAGNYTALPSRMLHRPRDGDLAVTTRISWATDTLAPGHVLHFDATGRRVRPLTQIAALYLDNTRSASDVRIHFPDTRFQILAPAGSQGYYPVCTNGLEWFALADAPTTSDETTILTLNFLPPPGVLMSKFELAETPPPVEPQPAALPSAFRYKGLWRISGLELPGYQAPMAIPATAFPQRPFTWTAWAPGLSAFFTLRPGTGAVPPARPTGEWLVGVYIENNADNNPAGWYAVGLLDFSRYPAVGQRGNVLWYAMPVDDQTGLATSNFTFINSPAPNYPIWTVLQCSRAPSQPASDMQIAINASILDYPLQDPAAAPPYGPDEMPPLSPLVSLS